MKNKPGLVQTSLLFFEARLCHLCYLYNLVNNVASHAPCYLYDNDILDSFFSLDYECLANFSSGPLGLGQNLVELRCLSTHGCKIDCGCFGLGELIIQGLFVLCFSQFLF
jgi:hypothetical protein